MPKVIRPPTIEQLFKTCGIKKSIINKKIDLFEKNPSHPSLRFKPYKSRENTFEISLNMNYRVLLEKKNNDEYLIIDFGNHDIL